MAEIDAAWDYIAQFSPAAAAGWYQGVYDQIASLADSPRRCAIAPEAAAFGKEMRHLMYGSRRNAYRIIFSIEAPNRVDVLFVRHGRRDVVRPV